MGDHFTFFCLASSSDVTIETVDDPAKHLRDVAASLSTSTEDPPSLADTPNTACLRVRFHGHSLISQIRNLEGVLRMTEKKLRESEWEIEMLKKEKQQYIDENQSLKAQTHKLISAQKEAANRESGLKTLLAEKEDELRTIDVEKLDIEDIIVKEERNRLIEAVLEEEDRYEYKKRNVETQIHDPLDAQKDAADREKKLAQTLNVPQSGNNAMHRELDLSESPGSSNEPFVDSIAKSTNLAPLTNVSTTSDELAEAVGSDTTSLVNNYNNYVDIDTSQNARGFKDKISSTGGLAGKLTGDSENTASNLLAEMDSATDIAKYFQDQGFPEMSSFVTSLAAGGSYSSGENTPRAAKPSADGT